MENIDLKYYIPLNGTYKVFVPEGFIIEDEEETGLLSMASIDGSSVLTISDYLLGLNDNCTLEELFESLTHGYEPLSELSRFDEKFDYLAEQSFQRDGRYWTWWLLANGKAVIVVSANSEEVLDEVMLDLYRFMVTHIQVLRRGGDN